MAIVIAVVGGLVLLLGFLLKCPCFQLEGDGIKGDRIAALVIGIGLIASGIVLEIGAPLVSLLTTFGITVALVLIYCLFLLLGRRPR